MKGGQGQRRLKKRAPCRVRSGLRSGLRAQTKGVVEAQGRAPVDADGGFQLAIVPTTGVVDRGTDRHPRRDQLALPFLAVEAGPVQRHVQQRGRLGDALVVVGPQLHAKV